MTRFVKALPNDCKHFKYLCEKFLRLSEAKLKERVIVWHDIRKMMFNSIFKARMTTKQRETWISFKKIVSFWAVRKTLL